MNNHFVIPDGCRRKFKHHFNILFISRLAALWSAKDFVFIAEFHNARKGWFAKALDLANGIRSHGRFNAIFSL